MFYEPKKKNHGLPKNPFNSLIIPRPIGWISSADESGIHNLAPYSFFQCGQLQSANRNVFRRCRLGLRWHERLNKEY